MTNFATLAVQKMGNEADFINITAFGKVATLMEKYGVPLHHRKLILGHSVQDLTEGVYTHVDPSVLVEDINRIPARFA